MSEKWVKNVSIITNVMEAVVSKLMNDAGDVQHRIATSIFSSSNTENLFEWISCDPHKISIVECNVAAVDRLAKYIFDGMPLALIVSESPKEKLELFAKN